MTTEAELQAALQTALHERDTALQERDKALQASLTALKARDVGLNERREAALDGLEWLDPTVVPIYPVKGQS